MTAAADTARPWLAQYPAVVPRSLGPDPDVPLHDYVRTAGDRYGDRALFLFCGATTSSRELHARVERFAAALQTLGVAKGDRVALMLPNCPQFAVAAGLAPFKVPRTIGVRAVCARRSRARRWRRCYGAYCATRRQQAADRADAGLRPRRCAQSRGQYAIAPGIHGLHAGRARQKDRAHHERLPTRRPHAGRGDTPSAPNAESTIRKERHP